MYRLQPRFCTCCHIYMYMYTVVYTVALHARFWVNMWKSEKVKKCGLSAGLYYSTCNDTVMFIMVPWKKRKTLLLINLWQMIVTASSHLSLDLTLIHSQILQPKRRNIYMSESGFSIECRNYMYSKTVISWLLWFCIATLTKSNVS